MSGAAAKADLELAIERERLVEDLTTELLDALNRFANRLVVEKAAFLDHHRLLEADGAAALLGVSVSWIRQATAGGDIPCVRLGGLVRYHPPTLIEWALSRQEVPDESSR